MTTNTIFNEVAPSQLKTLTKGEYDALGLPHHFHLEGGVVCLNKRQHTEEEREDIKKAGIHVIAIDNFENLFSVVKEAKTLIESGKFSRMVINFERIGVGYVGLVEERIGVYLDIYSHYVIDISQDLSNEKFYNEFFLHILSHHNTYC